MELKIGDRVKCISVYDDNPYVLDKDGVIVGITDRWYVSVQFDEEIPRGHSGIDGCGKEGYCWCMPKQYLEHVNKYSVNLIWGAYE